MKSYYLSEMTRDEIQEKLSEKPIAILPFGATEQHGKHLPLGTDTILAEYLSREVAKKINGIVIPSIPFGYSWVWSDIPGTITINHHTLELLLTDVISSVEKSGFRAIAIISGHGSNETTMKYVTRDYAANSNFPVYRFTYPNIDEIRQAVCVSETWFGMIHACEFETSLLLGVRPDLVDMSHAVNEYPPFSNEYRFKSEQLGSISKSGVFGAPKLATAQKGEQMLLRFVDEIATKILEMENKPGES